MIQVSHIIDLRVQAGPPQAGLPHKPLGLIINTNCFRALAVGARALTCSHFVSFGTCKCSQWHGDGAVRQGHARRALARHRRPCARRPAGTAGRTHTRHLARKLGPPDGQNTPGTHDPPPPTPQRTFGAAKGRVPHESRTRSTRASSCSRSRWTNWAFSCALRP